MTGPHHIKITGNGGSSHVVEIDGHPIQNVTRSLVLTIDGHSVPVLALDLIPRSTPDVDTQADLRINEELAEALKVMGWTPPPGYDPEVAGA